MTSLVVTLSCVLLICPLLLTSSQLESESNAFAVDLYKVLMNTSDNLVMSPLSLQILLALAYRGATGQTASEISTVIHQRGNTACTYRQLIEGLLNGNVLQLATIMYIDQSFTIKPCFKRVSQRCFLSDIRGADFNGNPEGARNEINSWVEEKTNNRIKNLFPEGSITSLTRLVLANAIYFKANWDRQFDQDNTRNRTFYTSTTQEVNATMMSIFGERFPNTYSTVLEANIVALPYKENDYRMVIFLPDEIDGLAELESKITSDIIINELSQLRNTSIGLSIPKFTMETSLELEESLVNLGMPTAFSPNATFTRISDERVQMDKVIQKALIIVNEEGTEAAAATGVTIGVTSAPPSIICDHPFLYMILKQNIILFVGKFSRP